MNGNIPDLISPETIDGAASLLLNAAPPGSEVILFGSYARGEADAGSDVDFMVVEPRVLTARSESIRLREAARSSRIPMDVLVVSRKRFDRWKGLINNVIADAAREGKVYRRGT